MTPDLAEETRAEGLVPPRPNLGPEPWSEPSNMPIGWGIFLLIVVATVLIWRWVRRRGKVVAAGSSKVDETMPEVDPSPRLRLIASSERVRVALIDAFGPAWGSRTTEEIVDDPRLIDRVSPEDLASLDEFLQLSDRAKFADHEPIDGWEAWSGGFVARLSEKAGESKCEELNRQAAKFAKN